MKLVGVLLIGVLFGVVSIIVISCLVLESRLDQEEEKREHELHMRR